MNWLLDFLFYKRQLSTTCAHDIVENSFFMMTVGILLESGWKAYWISVACLVVLHILLSKAQRWYERRKNNQAITQLRERTVEQLEEIQGNMAFLQPDIDSQDWPFK